MATFALIHGAGSAGFYWDRVRPWLEDAGHRTVAPDLPAGDPAADFDDYADTVDAALDGVLEGGATANADLVVVGQSLGGFTAPVVASRHPGSHLVLVAPMIPRAGETPGEYFQDVDLEAAQEAAAEAGGYDPSFDLERIFLHDVAPEVVAELMARGVVRGACRGRGHPTRSRPRRRAW
jgi:pimeloyl-ACP methyl ester carboxylesterase